MCIYTTEDFYECIYGYVECVVLLEQQMLGNDSGVCSHYLRLLSL